MICGLFSSFDPSVLPSSSGESWLVNKWVYFVFLLFFTWWQCFSFPSGKDLIQLQVMSKIFETINDIFTEFHKVALVLSTTFLLILSMNLWGLLPYYFSISSHLSVNLVFSLTLWFSGILVMVISSIMTFLAHVVPVGCPSFLWPLLVMVESVSVIIRPFTLSIRLMANVMAGHLIMSLMGQFFSFKLLLIPLSFPLVGFFLLFEVCISSVQAYVFMSLLSLYWKESEE